MAKPPINPAPFGLKDIVNQNAPATPIAIEVCPSDAVGNNLAGAQHLVQGGPATGPNGVPGEVCVQISDPADVTVVNPDDKQPHKTVACFGPNGLNGKVNRFARAGDPAVLVPADISGFGSIIVTVDSGAADIDIPDDDGTFLPGAVISILRPGGTDYTITPVAGAEIITPTADPIAGKSDNSTMTRLRYLGNQAGDASLDAQGTWIVDGTSYFAGGV